MPFVLQRLGQNAYYVINSITGHKHSKNSLTYHKARAQMRVLNAIYNTTKTKHDKISEFDEEAGSFFDSLKSGVKNVYGRVKGFITGVRNDFQPYVRSLLEKIKDKNVMSIVVIREPIKEAVGMLANAVSMGKIAEFKKQNGVDDLFHLFMILTLDDGTFIRVEKNSEIDIFAVNSLPMEGKDQNRFQVVMPEEKKTLNEMLDNTKNKIGDSLFYSYNPLSNNCQNFLYNVLFYNGFSELNPRMKQFIIQDLTKLSKTLSPMSKDVLSGITTLGKRVQILTGGAGFEKLKD